MHELTPTFIANKGFPTTHFDMDAVEEIGLVKMDILAQGGLAVMRDAKQSIARTGLPLAAFAGALLAIVLVFRVATATGRAMDVRVLLLAGVVIAAFFSACIAFILAVSPARTVQSAVLWIMGSLAAADWTSVALTAAYTLPASLLLVAMARPLNLMAIGEETAHYLGTDVEGVKRVTLGVAALITASGVAVAGVIGFVGLVVPHALRLVIGSDHRTLLPFSFLAGAAFLTLADLIARLAMPPTEIPIGVITAFIGVPFFLVLLRRSVSAP
jgi:iron complex transport system permease protein